MSPRPMRMSSDDKLPENKDVKRKLRLEKRRFHRWETEIPCFYRIGQALLDAVVHDISFSGAKIKKVESAPPVGAMFDLTLGTREDGPTIRCRVVWSDDIGYFGVEFAESYQDRHSKLLPLVREWVNLED